MTSEPELLLREAREEDLEQICSMEQGEAREFIIPWSPQRHRSEFANPDVVYKTLWLDDELAGFLILILDPDGKSIEFRRIVMSRPGRGYGKSAVRMVGKLCRTELGRRRIWLDVFEANDRARHVYESCGYRQFGRTEYEGRTLLLYEITE